MRQDGHQVLDLQWFDENVGCAGAAGFVLLFGTCAGDDADVGLLVILAHLAQDVDAAAVGEHEVEEDPLRRVLLDLAQGGGDGGRFRHGKRLPLENARDRLARRRVVLHDQDRGS